MAVSAYAYLYVSDSPLVWDCKFLSLDLERLAAIELSPYAWVMGIHGLKYMDIIYTVYSAPPSTLLTKSKILQSAFQYVVC